MTTLPEEILQNVCIHLRFTSNDYDFSVCKARRQTLLNFSRASKTFQRIASPSLYSALDLRLIGNSNLPLLLRTLVECPELPKLVEQVHVDTWEIQRHSEIAHASPRSATAEQRSQLAAAASAFSLSTGLRDRLANGLREGIEDAELTLLLLLCSRLRLLDFHAPYQVEDTLVMAVVAESVSKTSRRHSNSDPHDGEGIPAPPFALVKEIYAQHWDTEDNTSLHSLLPLLQLPALETLRGVMLGCGGNIQTLSPGRSNLRKLYLEQSMMDADGLSGLLRVFSKLEVLSMVWGDALVGPSNIHWDELGHVLRQYGSTLTALTFDTEDAEAFDDISFQVPLGQLKEMVRLRELVVPFNAVFQVSDDNIEEEADEGEETTAAEDARYLTRILPVSLQTFQINSAGEDDNAALRDAQLREVMMDPGFSELSTIRVERVEPFSLSLTDIGWDDAGSNEAWTVLQRISRT